MIKSYYGFMNENNKFDDVEDDIKTHFAYLLDDDNWGITVTDNGNIFNPDSKTSVEVSIDFLKEDEDGGCFEKWRKVKDKIIPPIKVLMKKYNIKDDFNIYGIFKNDEDDYENFKLEELETKKFEVGYIGFKLSI